MNNVRWIIQNNLIAENDLKEIQNACMLLNIDYEEVTIIPFSKKLPTFTIDNKTNIYYGSTTFMYNVYNQLNKPKGLFFNDNFSMENYLNVWKQHMLNSEAIITTLDIFTKENHPNDSLWFVRPDADDKSFNGDVWNFKDLKNWSHSFQKFDNVDLNEHTKIIVAPPYNIEKEWRTYIVNGKVITSSLYRKNFKLNKSNTDIPNSMIKFVEDRCIEYTPHNIFAMDIALCGGDYYIIECGCLNSVGLYKCNIHNLIKAVSNNINLS